MLTVMDGQHTTYSKLTIDILDLNDNAPEFVNIPYVRSLSQDTSAGRIIFTVEATDPDAGNNGYLTYWMGYTSDIFYLDTIRGQISLDRGLHSRTEESYDLTIYVRDHGVPSLVTQTTVTLYVNDSNIFAPRFSQFVYDINIPEDVEIDRFIQEFDITDQDSGDAGRFSITMTPLVTNENTTLPFTLYGSGDLYLREYLDFEVNRFYEFSIIATDYAVEPKSSTALVHITVLDVNDNTPKFSTYPDVLLYQVKLGL